MESNKPKFLMCNLMAKPYLCEFHGSAPSFTWVVPDGIAGGYQAAYQIQIVSRESFFENNTIDVWDSGIIYTEMSVGVKYSGMPLPSNSSLYWRVKVFGEDGNPSAWSDPQRFFIGDLSECYRGDKKFIVERYPLEEEFANPAEIVKIDHAHWFIDFGLAAFGTLIFEADSDTDDREIKVHLGEKLTERGSIDRTPPGTIRYQCIPVKLRAGRHSYRVIIPPDERNTEKGAILMPPHIGEVYPFRYCELEGMPSDILQDGIKQVRVNYPFDCKAASFESSDEVLNQIWNLCKNTIKAMTFCGVYVDGDRERIPYEGDTYINQLTHYCMDREYTLARYSLEYLLHHPTWGTEWILHTILIAWADYLYTGDKSTIESYYEVLKIKTLYDLERTDGLISSLSGNITPSLLDALNITHDRSIFESTIRDVIDWPPAEFTAGCQGERDGYNLMPVNAVVNAFHYKAIFLMSRIANAIGNERDEKWFSDRAELVKRSFNENLFDKKRGIYVDGEGTDHASLHANMFPLAFGMVAAENVKSVVAFIKSRGMACSVYGAQYLLDALYDANEAEYALQLMTSKAERGWWHMIECGATITWEAWDYKFKNNIDWNHAWGAAPGNIIPRRLMGIRPMSPGFSEIQIRPQPGSLECASMRLPTIRGEIFVSFTQQSGKFFELKVKLPANTKTQIFIPLVEDKAFKLSKNGSFVKPNISGKYAVFENMAPGRHSFAVAY